MLTRFELFVILRNQLADRTAVRRSLAVEATMEALAREGGRDPAPWGLAGLGASIDVALTANNPGRRGEVARELLLAEGAPAEVADAVRERVAGGADRLAPIAAALVVAESLVDGVYGALSDDTPFESVEPAAIAHRIRRAAERRGDEGAARVIACAARIGVAIDRAAALCVDAMRRAREDLRP